jgi:hypothetical protein
MPKKRTTYRLEQELLRGIKALAIIKRWDQTTVVEVGVEELLKAQGLMNEKRQLTDKALEILRDSEGEE